MLTSSNIKITFSFPRVSKIAIATLKFVNKDGAKKQGNRVLEFKKITQSIYRLENNFYVALW